MRAFPHIQPPFLVRRTLTRVILGVALAFAGTAIEPQELLAEETTTNSGHTSAPKLELQKHVRAVGQMRNQVRNIWSGNTLRLGTTAIYVVDANSGEELYKVHANAPLNPASNVKLVSTATVLATLGPDWRFETKVIGPKPDTEGVINGGVYLLGNYDPTLGPDGLTDLAQKLSAQGVKEIHGNLVFSNSDLRDSLANKRVRVTVRGGANSKRPSIEVWPTGDFANITLNSAHTRARGRSQIGVSGQLIQEEGKAPHLNISVRGSIRRGHQRVVHLLAKDRGSFTASTFRQALKDNGIEVLGSVEFASFDDFSARSSQSSLLSEPLAVHESATIASLVSRVNKRSMNYLADRLVMSAARSRHHGPLEMESAITLMKEWLAGIGIDPDKVVIDTGSGLSYRTKLSTQQIVTVLRAAGGYSMEAANASSDTFRNSLSIGGHDGTLRNRFKQKGVRLSGNIVGKTGTLTSVIALSGFLSSKSGRMLSFAIVTNGHKNELKRNVRLAHEHIVGKLDAYLQRPGSQLPSVSNLSPLWKASPSPASPKTPIQVPSPPTVEAKLPLSPFPMPSAP